MYFKHVLFEDTFFDKCYFEDVTSTDTYFKNCTIESTIFYNTGKKGGALGGIQKGGLGFRSHNSKPGDRESVPSERTHSHECRLGGEEMASTPYIRCPEMVWHLSDLYLSFFHM